jgi:solute carrier family 13 (sodium-dependent dicarboxylate transporter), member 2/3/5
MTADVELAEDTAGYTAAEARFERRRQTVGLLLAPLCFAAMMLAPFPGLSAPAHRTAAVLVPMIVLWMTEGLPLPVTALLGPTALVLLGVGTVQTVFAAFADPIIFLFIGSFILAEGMAVHRLDRRLAFAALGSTWVGSSGIRLTIAYASVCCLISMWFSNSATTAMMYPLGLAVVNELGKGREGDPALRRYGTIIMLVTSFAACLGGMGTPVGTPPNLIGMGLLREAGIDISFVGWMTLGVPIMVISMAFVIVWLLIPQSRGIALTQATARAVAAELQRLGPMTPGERNVLVAFALTVSMWIVPGLCDLFLGSAHVVTRGLGRMLPESIAALVGATLLFVLPIDWRARRFTLTWHEASRIDWGIILLFGGGLSMGKMADSTGLAAAMGHWVAGAFPDAGSVGLTLVFTALALVMSETASNTASANVIVPTAIAVARAAGVSPLEPALGATLGASLGFMLPISTPPNAVIYSTGRVPITAMIRYGIVLDIVGYFIVVGVVLSLSWLVR